MPGPHNDNGREFSFPEINAFFTEEEYLAAKAVLREAGPLLDGEPGEVHPEYTRAITELTTCLLGLPMERRAGVEEAIRVSQES